MYRPQKLDLKSNFGRSVFFWQNTVLFIDILTIATPEIHHFGHIPTD